MKNETVKAYAVEISGAHGDRWLALGNSCGPFISGIYRSARQFRKELQNHLSGKTKVVRVKVTFEWE